MPDSVTVLVVPGLTACGSARAELERHLPEWVPLGPSFPVLEQVVLGTLFSGQEGPGLALWTRGHFSGENVKEQPLWLWDHLARYRPHLPSACWLLPLPGQRATLGACPAGGNESGSWNIWPPAVREVVQRECGAGPRLFPLEPPAPEELQASLEKLLQWCFASAAVAFRWRQPALGVVYVPVVLAGAYLWGPNSSQGAALARCCAAEVLEFLTRVRAGTNTRDANAFLVVDPWGLQEVEQVVDLGPVCLHLGELAEQLAPGRKEPAPVFTLQVEHQVARLAWSPKVPLTAERLREELTVLMPPGKAATAQQCGLVPADAASPSETRAELWLLAPEGSAFTCSYGELTHEEGASPKVQIACWELPAWLKRWGIEFSPAVGFQFPRTTHGLAPRRQHQQGRLWTDEPGLLFGRVVSDLDLAALVLCHWGI